MHNEVNIMVTLRREMTSDTKRREYDRRNRTRNYRDDRFAYTEIADKKNVSPEYLEYLWAELDRTEPRRTLRPEEYSKGHNSRNNTPEYRKESVLSRNIQQNRNQSVKNSGYGRLDKKGIIAIVAYFLIVAIIATLIIVNGSINAPFDPATGSQAEVSTAAGNEMNSTANLPVISQEALDMVILNDGTVINIDLLDKSNAYAYQSPTNWFDKLCDSLSFIAGG